MHLSSRVLSVLVTLLIMLTSIPANAQGTGQGLEISPPLVELKVDPGQTVSFEIRLRNIIKTSLIARATIDDFVSGGEDGQPKLLLNNDAEPSPYSFKGWVSSMPELLLASQEAKTAKITMKVPKDAAPGGHYGVVRFTGTAPDIDSTGVALSASIGTLVLVNVSGNITTKATMEEFYTSQNNKKSSLFETGPIGITERIKNQGSVHIKPQGTVRITNMFGKEVKVLSVNEKGGNILPGGIRKFDQKLDKKWMFGRYTAETNIQYSGKTLNDTLTFWVIPYRIIAIALGILLLLVAGLRVLIKRYNRMIINKAKEGKSGGKKAK